MSDTKRSTQRHGPLYLQTRPGKGDVFQVGHSAPDSSGLVLPLDIYQVCTQQSSFNASLQHIYHVYRLQLYKILQLSPRQKTLIPAVGADLKLIDSNDIRNT